MILPLPAGHKAVAVSPLTWAGPNVTDPANEGDIVVLDDHGQVWHAWFKPAVGWNHEQIC